MRSKLRALRERYRADGAAGAARAVGGYLATLPGTARRRAKAYRVDRRKASMSPTEASYDHDPDVTLIVQWFNQRGMVETVADGLPRDPAHEVVVCEDGSVDGSLAAWRDRLTRRNDFLVRSNDLHEIRTYTRAIGLARGDVVCLLQDDDELPPTTDWIDGTLALFDAHPDLGVVCGQTAWSLDDLDPDFAFDPPHESHPRIDRWLAGEDGGFRDERPGDVPTVDPHTGRPFVFTPCISVGPVFVRQSVFRELGGFDLDFSEPGQPGMGFEVDFALRCWRAGHEVGFTPMGLDRGAVGGTMTFAQQDRADAHEEAWARLAEKHREAFDDIAKRVWRANGRLDAR